MSSTNRSNNSKSISYNRINKDSKYIAEGTYGCVFDPAFKCNNKYIKNNQVGKIFADDDEAENEYIETIQFKNIDPDGLFFIYPYYKCNVSLETIKSNSLDNSYIDCSLIKKNIKKHYTQLISQNGGLSLDKFFNLNYKNNKIDRATLIYIMSNIFYGIKALLLNNLIHQDIKLPNIVISEYGIKLIDFGLMIDKYDFYTEKNFVLFDKSIKYGVNPPEYRIYQYITRDLRETTLKSRIQNLKNIEYNILNDYIADLKPSMKGIENSYISMSEYNKKNPSNESMIKFLKKNKIHEKSDLFSLGGILSDLAYYYCIPIEDDDQEIVDLFNKLVSNMTELNVLKRCNIDETIKLVQVIINTQSSSFYFKDDKKINKKIIEYFNRNHSNSYNNSNSFNSPNKKKKARYSRTII